jgi:GT2 family glycosyltransferase
MPPDVSVIVVTWNARDHIDQCLDAVLGAGGAGVDLELVVVDNASSDGTAEHVRERYPQARVLETGRNGGMAAGNNAGMLAAQGRAFLLLNSDAFLHEGALRTLLERLDSEPAGSVAAVAPLLRNVDGTIQRSVRGFPTPWRYATEFFYLRRLARGSRVLNAFYGGGVDVAKPGRVDWVTGACLLVPRDAVDAVGLMDEAYFMYGEEVDWLDRMRQVERAVCWEPRAVATHVGGGSARSSWGALYQRQLANHVRYMRLRRGERAAVRTRRVLRAALVLRAGLWRTASLVPIGGRDPRRARAEAFRAGARTIAAIDPHAVDAPVIPSWPGLQRAGSSTR